MIKFSIPQLINKISKLEDVIIQDDRLFMETITLTRLNTLVSVILHTLYKVHTLYNEEAVALSMAKLLNTFIGEELNRSVLRSIVRIAVSASDVVKKGEDYPLWRPDGTTGWGLFFVSDIVRSAWDNNKYDCVIECKAGHPVNHIIEKTVSSGYLIHILKESGGRKYEKYPPVYMGGMFFASSLVFRNTNYKFDDFYTTSSISNHNKKLLKEREKPCAKNMTKTCDVCFIGTDMCNRSPHKHTYRPGMCKNEHKGYVVQSTGYCMTCLRKGRTK